MSIVTSGTINLSSLQTEFGGTNPVSLGEYYKDGGRVLDISVNSAVPSSGPISLGDMYGSTYARPFQVIYLGSGLCSAPSSITPTVSDPRCTIIVIQSRSSGSTSLRPGATAIIGNTTGTLIDQHYSTAFDDGVAITITSKLVTHGASQSLTFPNADGAYYVFQYIGVEDLYNAITDTDFVYNTDGGNNSIARTYVTLTAVAGRSCVLFIPLNKTSYSGEPTGKLDVYVAPGTAMGFDTNPVTGSNTYNFENTPRMLLGFTLNKEVPLLV